MKKLNENGWGLIIFLVLLGILFLAILVVSYLANQFDESLPKSSDRISYHYVEKSAK